MRPRFGLSPAAKFVAAKLFTVRGGDCLARLLRAGRITSQHISATRRTGGKDCKPQRNAGLDAMKGLSERARPRHAPGRSDYEMQPQTHSQTSTQLNSAISTLTSATMRSVVKHDIMGATLVAARIGAGDRDR